MYHRVYHRVFEMLVGFVSLKVAESTQLFSNQNYELLKFLVRGLAMLARPVHRKLCQGRGGSTRRGGGRSTLSEVERLPRRLGRSVPHFAKAPHLMTKSREKS